MHKIMVPWWGKKNIMMRKKMNKISVILVSIILAVSVAGCTAAAKAPVTITRPATVQRGNLDVTVSVDGNLNMPQAFDLHFGAPGNVLNINVKEGDIVKAGTVLATLDDTAQALAIKTANNAVQTKLASLYETVPRLPNFMTTFYGTIPPTGPDAGLVIVNGFPIQVPPGIIIYSRDNNGNPIPSMGSPGGWHNDISLHQLLPHRHDTGRLCMVSAGIEQLPAAIPVRKLYRRLIGAERSTGRPGVRHHDDRGRHQQP